MGFDCILNIIRALGMGSCLSADGRSSISYSSASTSESTPTSGGPKKKKTPWKKQSRRNSPSDLKREEWLHRIPERRFLNGSTEFASLFTKQGKKGVNQDAMIVWENFGSRTDTILCGVFDGHGPFGHMVAKSVRDSLPLKLSSQLELNIGTKKGLTEACPTDTLVSADDESCSSSCHDIFMILRESLLKAFKVMDKELKLHPYIDSYCSGTTAVTLVKQGQDLVIGNVGDSRAVLATRDKDSSLIAVQLTVDLKPNLPREAERIKQCKGRVFALQAEPDVSRLWLPHTNSPGLAMARAFGDFCLKDFGLIAVPDISYHRLTDKDEFVVLATDGVWDVFSNKEVVDIVASAPRSTAARVLVDSAVQAWRYKYPTSKVDDCAVVCLFFASNSATTSASSSTLPSLTKSASSDSIFT